VTGRFIRPDGSLSRRAEGAVGIWLTDPGSDTLASGTGTIVATPDVGFFGGRAVDTTGRFIDYDGARQSAPDITTRGMADTLLPGHRYYLDVYPALTTTPLGVSQPPLPPQPGQPGEPEEPPAACPAVGIAPHTKLDKNDISVGPHHLQLSGSSLAGSYPCGAPANIDHVDVAIAKRIGHHICRFLNADGELGKRRSCKQLRSITAQGAEQFSLEIETTTPAGRYSAVALGVDSYGFGEVPGPDNRVRFRIR